MQVIHWPGVTLKMILIISFKQVTLRKWKEEHESLKGKELCGGIKIESPVQTYFSGKYSHICMKKIVSCELLCTHKISVSKTLKMKKQIGPFEIQWLDYQFHKLFNCQVSHRILLYQENECLLSHFYILTKVELIRKKE